jgi:DnaK suppressor protein
MTKHRSVITMKNENDSGLDEAFLARQHERLVRLRAMLISGGDAAAEDEDLLQKASGGEPQDAADDGDRLEQQANDEAVLRHAEARVIAVDRALQKIRDHTYGISDGNGEFIGRAHLEAVPEAVYTAEELRYRETQLRTK